MARSLGRLAVCSFSGVTVIASPAVVWAQPDELQQLEDFLSPPPTESLQLQTAPAQPPYPAQSLPAQPLPPASPIPHAIPTTSAESTVVTPPSRQQPLPSQPLVQPQLAVLSLNSHSPGTLGNPRQLHEGYYQDLFQFEGQMGELILLNLIGSDDPRMELDPRLQLIAPDGSIVAEDDNGGYDSARGDARIVLMLPDTGSYTVVVTTADPDDRGRYTLGLLEVDDPSQIQ
ncbi:MAG: hypothetical protein AB4050_05140 [Synechococcus sp.]